MGVFIRSSKERKEDKDLKEYYEQMDKIEKEIAEEEKKNRIKISDLFKKDPYEEELRQYMTKEQLEEEEKDKKREKKVTIISFSILGAACIVIVAVMVFLGYALRGDLEKIHKKEVLEYYKNTYGTNIKINTINYLCDINTDDTCNNKIKVVTDNDETIYKIDGKFYDNIYISNYLDEYNNYIRSINPDMNAFWNSPYIYNLEFSDKFNMFSNDIKIFPSKGNMNEVIGTQKFGVVDILMYQGELNTQAIQNFINTLDGNSRFYFIKSINGDLVEVNYFYKGGNMQLPIVEKQVVNVIYTIYKFDPSVMDRFDLTFIKNNHEGIDTLDEKYMFDSAYTVNVDSQGKNNSFYFVSINNISVNYDNVVQFANNKELDKSAYKNMYVAGYGNKTYLFGNSSISFGTKQEIKKSIFN